MPYSSASYYKYIRLIVYVCVVYWAGIVRNRKARHPVRPISAFPVVTLLRDRLRVPGNAIQWWNLGGRGGHLLSSNFKSSPTGQSSARCLHNWCYITQPIPLNQTHKGYKEDTDFNFIFIQGLVMLLRVLSVHPRSYNIVFKYLYKLTSI